MTLIFGSVLKRPEAKVCSRPLWTTSQRSRICRRSTTTTTASSMSLLRWYLIRTYLRSEYFHTISRVSNQRFKTSALLTMCERRRTGHQNITVVEKLVTRRNFAKKKFTKTLGSVDCRNHGIVIRKHHHEVIRFGRLWGMRRYGFYSLIF